MSRQPVRLETMTPIQFARRLCFLAALALFPCGAGADSWPPPSTKATTSANGQFRVTIVPRGIGSPLEFFEDKVKGRAPAGQRKGDAQASPLARVQQRGPNKQWRML